MSSMQAVEVRLRALVEGRGLVGDACAHLVAAPQAKRARPRLLLAFAALTRTAQRPTDPQLEPRAIAAAAAVELIHTASLLHDDVVDEADARRGRPSVNARFGNSAAVLAGDVLLSRALRELNFDPRAVAAAVEVVGAMSVAAVREVEVRGCVGLPLEEHAWICDGKTAVLFGLCGRLAGILADDLEAAARFESAARALGLAFQLADDVGDVANDLLERTPTHPILVAAAREASVAEGIVALWGAKRADAAAAARLAERIAAGPGPAASLELVRAHVARAQAELAPWAGRPAHHDIFRFAATLEVSGRS